MGNCRWPLISNCTVSNIAGTGIQVCLANNCQIRDNKIFNNENGIEVICGDPTISTNKIYNNNGSGIITKSINNFYCEPTIDHNFIR